MITADDPIEATELQSMPTMADAFWDLAPALVWVASRSESLVTETPKDAGTVDLMVRFRRWHRTERVVSPDPGVAWVMLAEQIALGKVRAYGFEGAGIAFGSRRQLSHEAMDLRLDFEPGDLPGRSYLKLYSRANSLEHYDLQIAREDLQATFPVPSQAEAPVPEAALSLHSPATPRREFIRGKGGRKPVYSWDAARAYAAGLLDEYGMPGVDQPALASQAALEGRVIQFLRDKDGREPATSTVRTSVAKWLKDWEAGTLARPE